MTGTLIASTPKASMRALAFQGIMAYSCFPQIRDMLLRGFGEDYALLFARPVENLADGVIDWYSPLRGEPRGLEELPAAEREAICRRVAAMAGEIQKAADELIESREPLKTTRGNILKLALRYPDDCALRVIGGQPVFICWGFAPGTPGVEARNLARLTSAPAPEGAPESPAAAPARAKAALSPGWLWWLLPVAPLFLLFLICFMSFGGQRPLSGMTLLDGPELPFMARKPEHGREIAALEEEIAALRSELEKHAALCVQREEAKTPLVIPGKARDAAFMEGSWLCDTGLASKRTGQPVRLLFNFGQDGRGKGITYEKNDQCEGQARAEMRGEVLHIELGAQHCARTESSYGAVAIDCRAMADGRARCFGTNQDGTTWDAAFSKAD